MNRRTLIKAAAALPLLRIPGAGAEALPELARAARDAWIFGLPPVEMAQARARMLGAGLPPNRLFHRRALATASDRAVTTPNNDTLYSVAWLNLAAGPVRLTLPASGARYLSVALLDMYTDNFAVLGTRTTGRDGGSFTLVGPGAATDDPLAIRATTGWVWLLARTLVDGEADLPAAHAVQDGIRLEGPAAPLPAGSFAGRDAPWGGYFASLQALLAESPPRATDLGLLRAIAPLGIGGGFDPARFTPAQAAEIERGVAEARAAVRGSGWGGRIVDGWTYPRANLGLFGQDYLYRAQIALGGLAALPREEAMYMRAFDDRGRGTFAPGSAWRLRFPAGKPLPLDGFWSLTLYRATPDGQFFFAGNPLGRYAVGDRTPGLQRGAGGALDLLVSAADPGEGSRANWLPAPASEPFALIFRAYLPRAELLDGAYALPRLARA
ncbi:MAG: DUF1254 domain-containing protein [Sphingomonas sp.]